MPFVYQPDDEDEEEEREFLRQSQDAAWSLADSAAQGGFVADADDVDYDLQAALDIEAAEMSELNHLVPAYGASSSRRAYAPSRLAAPPRSSNGLFIEREKSKGKGKEREQPVQVHEIDSNDEEDEDDQVFEEVQTQVYGSAVHANSQAPDKRVEAKNREIAEIDAQIQELQAARSILVRERNELAALQRERSVQKVPVPRPAASTASQKTVNYNKSTGFSWTSSLQSTLQRVFGISKLRLCQEGVLNAVMHGRDVICIMPTGGGKSVCYQAPAVLTQGCTLVISPLLSLMADQVMHLREKGVEAVMLTGSTDHAEIKEITRRLLSSESGSRERPIKLCYVTPEKMAKSKTFTNTLSKMNQAGLLARIAIDEAHCCSQMGHDFRPDYKKLSTLKQLFPSVPIIALTATCGKTVLNDMVRILRLRSCTSGENAEPNKTVFFSSPLYRKNLHYSIRSKPTSAPAVIEEMVAEIMAKHANHTGIIYCLSQKDTITVAQGIAEASEGKIRTGTYHAGMDDHQKQRIHENWRSGRVKCVVATIAFGLGIDAPDVRYVYHHCISKSMEGYYQETGRAGRDGNDSDCVLWFRPADATRLSTLAMNEVEGDQKLYNMLKFAIAYTTCRKLLFDAYFGNPAQVVAPFTVSDQTRCGHCDNCVRATDEEASITVRDATLDAWRACKIIKEMDRQSGRVTLQQACALVRGLQKASFNTKNKGEKGAVNIEETCGSKVTLSAEDTELLLLKLLIDGYLKEEFFATAYSTISYIVPGPSVARLTRLPEAQLEMCESRIELTTLGGTGTKVKKKRGKKKSESTASESDEPPKKARKAKEPSARGSKGSKETAKTKAARKKMQSESEDDAEPGMLEYEAPDPFDLQDMDGGTDEDGSEVELPSIGGHRPVASRGRDFIELD